jgi:hypothetical protein
MRVQAGFSAPARQWFAIHEGDIAMIKFALATLVGATALAAAPAPVQAQSYRHHSVEVTCSSHHGQYNTCRLPYRGTARLVHQLSGQACVRGRTWGERGNSRIWVSRGCRGVFAVRSDRRYDDRVGDRGFVRDRNYYVECRAYGRRTTCNWDNRYGTPYIIRTTSGSCVEGRDWGYDRNGRIWVDADCNARFGYHF